MTTADYYGSGDGICVTVVVSILDIPLLIGEIHLLIEYKEFSYTSPTVMSYEYQLESRNDSWSNYRALRSDLLWFAFQFLCIISCFSFIYMTIFFFS